MRKTSEELEQIKKDLKVDRLWSWSRINCYMTDPYEYMLRYILRVPEDRNDSIYGVSGTISHDLVEKFSKNRITNQQMLEEYEDKLFEFNAMGLKYNRSDEDKNRRIADKYESCMRHFFLNHKRVTDKPIIEPFILIKVGNQYFNGYIDMLHIEKRNKRKKIIITDFKTSSIYKGEKLLENLGQLMLYGEGMHQKTKMPYEDIIVRFNFMKYVDVIYTQKKGDKKTRQIERNSIGLKLQSNARMWLKHYGYEDDTEMYLEQMIDTNGIECLPKEVQNTFEINDCYVEVELNEEMINKHKEHITNIIVEIISKEKEFEKTKDRNVFWKDIDKSSSYYLANLSNYSAKIHLPYKKYLEEQDFNNGIRAVEDKNIIEDLDWLDEIM